MAAAVRVGDPSTHGGTVSGPGVASVRIGGSPAAVVGDLHVCAITSSTHLVSSTFLLGSATVTIAGRPALRTTDVCLCGATAAAGAPNVSIG